MTEYFVRSYPLEDIKIRKGGTGRTVEAYAAVFNTPAEIRDQDGHYMEDIDSRSFTRTLNNKGTRFGVFYNHGLTIHGTPSDQGSVPIGTPQEVRADSRGLLTITEYNRTPLAEAVLEAIHTGSITGQSFTGRFMRSNPARVPRGRSGGKLPKVTRLEIDLKEYGPTPFPAYQEAAITGVRSALSKFPGGGLISEMVEAVAFMRALKLMEAEGATEEEIQAFLAEHGSDLPEIGSSRGSVPSEPEPSRSETTPATPPTDPAGPGTPPQDPPAGDPAKSHSARLRIARAKRALLVREKSPYASTQEERGSQGKP